jgi:hypothetical protein
MRPLAELSPQVSVVVALSHTRLKHYADDLCCEAAYPQMHPTITPPPVVSFFAVDSATNRNKLVGGGNQCQVQFKIERRPTAAKRS